MKKVGSLLVFMMLFITATAQQSYRGAAYTFWHGLSIGTGADNTPGASVMCQFGVSGGTQGILLPRVHDTTAIASPIIGMTVFSLVDSTEYYYTNHWKSVTSGTVAGTPNLQAVLAVGNQSTIGIDFRIGSLLTAFTRPGNIATQSTDGSKSVQLITSTDGTTNEFRFINSTTLAGSLQCATLSDNRQWLMRDMSGTVAFLSDIISGTQDLQSVTTVGHVTSIDVVCANATYTDLISASGFFEATNNITGVSTILSATASQAQLVFQKSGRAGNLVPSGVTTNPTWTLRDQTGTIAFLSDITGAIPNLEAVTASGNTTDHGITTTNGSYILQKDGSGTTRYWGNSSGGIYSYISATSASNITIAAVGDALGGKFINFNEVTGSTHFGTILATALRTEYLPDNSGIIALTDSVLGTTDADYNINKGNEIIELATTTAARNIHFPSAVNIGDHLVIWRKNVTGGFVFNLTGATVVDATNTAITTISAGAPSVMSLEWDGSVWFKKN